MIRIQRDAISTDEVLRIAQNARSGAVVLFLGTVRNHSHGRAIESLEYEAYDSMAEKELAGVEKEVRERWPIESSALVHRLGKMVVGDISVAIAVSTAHRKDAFEACRYAIDRIKQVVPIWKTEKTEDGDYIIEGDQARRI